MNQRFTLARPRPIVEFRSAIIDVRVYKILLLDNIYIIIGMLFWKCEVTPFVVNSITSVVKKSNLQYYIFPPILF